MREEAYTNLKIVCPDMMGVYELKLKVDTGASGSTTPLRIAMDMCGNQWQSKAEPAKHTKLKAYKGGEIKCFGTLIILCQYKNSEWRKYKFYIVDVPGPARLGLRACEQIRILAIHSIESCKDTLVYLDQDLQKVTINSTGGLKKTLPDRFDCIGSFRGQSICQARCDTFNSCTTQM